jgi:hypothetical protein
MVGGFMASKGDINKYEIQPSYPIRWPLVSYDEILEKTKIDVALFLDRG